MISSLVARKLGDVCTLQRGFDLPTRDRVSGAFPLVSSSGIIDTHHEGPIKAPGVVTGRSGSIGNLFYVKEDFWPLNTTLYVRDFHGNDPRFVYHLLYQFDLKRFAGGTGVPTLNRNDVHDVIVHVPNSVGEQQRIVAILDEAFDGIATAKANAEKNLQNANRLFGSYLQSAFGQNEEQVELLQVATDISDGDHSPPPKSASGVPFITISNIDKASRRINFDDTFTVSAEYFAKLKPNRKPKRGDVLYTVTGSFGIPVLVDHDNEFCFQRHIGLVRPNANTDSRWLNYALLSPHVLSQANARATGTAQKTVSLSVLRSILVPKVPLKTQRIVAAKLVELEVETQRLESLYQQKLTALDELKKSLLHEAFRGRL